jgi:hypothetical protein
MSGFGAEIIGAQLLIVTGGGLAASATLELATHAPSVAAHSATTMTAR